MQPKKPTHHTVGILTGSGDMIVCRAAQEAGAPHRGYIDRKKENVIFTPLYLGDTLSDWNQIFYNVSRQPGEYIYTKFEENCSSHFRDTSCQSFDSFFFLLCVFAYLQKLL